MSLTKLFNKYIGQSIKDPARLTCDCDDVADNLRASAGANGLMVNFVKAGVSVKDDAPMDRLIVDIESDAVSNGWKIKGLNILPAKK